MNEDISNMKELVINNTLYAHYLIEDDIMYMKTRKLPYPKDEERSELFLIELISIVENKKIPYVAYLNIK